MRRRKLTRKQEKAMFARMNQSNSQQDDVDVEKWVGDSEIEQKKRFIRDKLHISTKDMSSKEINSFFDRIARTKKKYESN